MGGAARQASSGVVSVALGASRLPVAGMPGWSSRRTAVVLAVCGAAFGVYVLVVTVPDRHAESTTTLFSGAVGGLYLGAGLLARLRRSANPVGLLMLLVGIGWFAEDLQISTDPVVHTVGLLLHSASSGFLVPLLLVFPGGRLRSLGEGASPAAVAADRALVAACCAVAFVLVPVSVLFHASVVPNLLLVHPVNAAPRSARFALHARGGEEGAQGDR